MNTQGKQVEFTDQDRLDDLLSQEKQLISAYSTFIPEASCPQLRQVLTDNFNGCVQNQFTVFDQMSQMGWYPTKPAPVPDIQAARQKFQQMKQQIG
ncbi:MAG: spore coat protein [Clostridiales bacterium]|nr:spore coat protein [Clostridiales bacterium]